MKLEGDYNKIRLIKGSAKLTPIEYKYFDKYDSLMHENIEILNTWDIKDLDYALNALSSYKNDYCVGSSFKNITEYALEIYMADENGLFLYGSDFLMAEDKIPQYVQL